MSKISPIPTSPDNPLIRVIKKRIHDSSQGVTNAEKYLLRDKIKQLDILSTAEDLFLEICVLEQGKSLRYYEWKLELEKILKKTSLQNKIWSIIKLVFYGLPPRIKIYFRDLDNLYKTLLPKVQEEKLSKYTFAKLDHRFQSEQNSQVVQNLDESSEEYCELDISLPENDINNLQEDNYLSRKFHDTLNLFSKAGIICDLEFNSSKAHTRRRLLPEFMVSFYLSREGIDFFKRILQRRNCSISESEEKSVGNTSLTSLGYLS